MIDIEIVVERLSHFKVEVDAEKKPILQYLLEKTEQRIKNLCNVDEIPEGLEKLVIDMTAAAYISDVDRLYKLVDVELSEEAMIKEIAEGDTRIEFRDKPTEQTFDTQLSEIVDKLAKENMDEIIKYRRLCW